MKAEIFATSLLLTGLLTAGNWPAWRGEHSNGAITGDQPKEENGNLVITG
jgi:hypothetical protein